MMTIGLTRRTLALGLLLGLATRLATLACVDYRVDAGDSATYLQEARNLLQYGVYSHDTSEPPRPSAYRPPLYSATLAAIAAVAGESTRVIQILQILLSLFTGILVAAITARHAPPSAPWAFFGMMLSPFEAVYSGAILSETITTFLLACVASTLLLARGQQRWVVAGLLSGLLALCRDIYLPLVVLFAAIWAARGAGPSRQRLKDAFLLLGATAVVVLPWTARNAVVLGSFVPISSGRLGGSLWVATWVVNTDFARADGYTLTVFPPEATRTADERRLVAEAFAPETTHQRKDDILRHLAFARFRDEPMAVLARCMMRWPQLWLGTRYDIFTLHPGLFPRGSAQWITVKSLLWGANFALLAFGAFGAWLAVRRRSALSWLLLPIAFTGAAYFPTNSYENRYSQPVLAWILLFAALAATELGARISRVRTTLRPGSPPEAPPPREGTLATNLEMPREALSPPSETADRQGPLPTHAIKSDHPARTPPEDQRHGL